MAGPSRRTDPRPRPGGRRRPVGHGGHGGVPVPGAGRHRFVHPHHDDGPRGHGPDPGRRGRPGIDRLVTVLVDNACKYAGAGRRPSRWVSASGERVTLTVDDTGPGIPAADRDLVFDRFHRTDLSPGGTGLGLAIADAVVRAVAGTWTVSDSPLGGARFEVSWRQALPRGDSAPRCPSELRRTPLPDQGKHRSTGGRRATGFSGASYLPFISVSGSLHRLQTMSTPRRAGTSPRRPDPTRAARLRARRRSGARPLDHQGHRLLFGGRRGRGRRVPAASRSPGTRPPTDPRRPGPAAPAARVRILRLRLLVRVGVRLLRLRRLGLRSHGCACALVPAGTRHQRFELSSPVHVVEGSLRSSLSTAARAGRPASRWW